MSLFFRPAPSYPCFSAEKDAAWMKEMDALLDSLPVSTIPEEKTGGWLAWLIPVWPVFPARWT